MEDFKIVMQKLLEMMSLIRQEYDMLDEVVPLGWVDGLAVSIETLLLENSF